MGFFNVSNSYLAVDWDFDDLFVIDIPYVFFTKPLGCPESVEITEKYL